MGDEYRGKYQEGPPVNGASQFNSQTALGTRMIIGQFNAAVNGGKRLKNWLLQLFTDRLWGQGAITLAILHIAVAMFPLAAPIEFDSRF
jgi:hypothetical protein